MGGTLPKYSALTPDGRRVLLEVGQFFDKHGVLTGCNIGKDGPCDGGCAGLDDCEFVVMAQGGADAKSTP
jgi:hypothetical protein